MPKQITFLVILTRTFAAIYVVTYAERFSDDVWALRLRDCHLDSHSDSIHRPGLPRRRLHAALAAARRAAVAGDARSAAGSVAE